jgi:signal transduction histidine kinase/ligand-binding sensor domain-containing protein
MVSALFRRALLAMVLVVPVARGQELPFTHYRPESEINPLPSAEVRSLYQDRLGYVWVVMYSSGLVRYDGHTMEVYGVADGLAELTVRQVMEDGAGRLWVASNAGLFVSDLPLQDYPLKSRVRFTQRIGSVDLLRTTLIQNRMAVDRRGRLWAGPRSRGLLRYAFAGSDSLSADTLRTGTDSSGRMREVRSLAVLRDGTVAAGLVGGTVAVFTALGVVARSFTLSAVTGDRPSEVLFEDSRGVLWGAAANGAVWRLPPSDGPSAVEVVVPPSGTYPNCIAEGPPGTLWVGSEGGGVARIRPDSANPAAAPRVERYSPRNGLLSANVTSVLYDREGNIWFGQVGGISRLRSNYEAFVNYTATSHAGDKPPLAYASVTSVQPLRVDGLGATVAAGTSGGGVTFLRLDGASETISTPQGLENVWVNSLTLDSRRRLWIGTTDGLNCMPLGDVPAPPQMALRQRVSLWGRTVSVTGRDRITAYAGRSLPLPGGAGGEPVECLWFSASRAIHMVAGDEWFVFRAESGLPVTFFHDVAMDAMGVLWVGTQDYGLYRSIGPVTLERFREGSTPLPGMGTNEITTVMFEQVWDVSRGAPTNQIETMAWRDGRLWIGTPDGLACLSTANLTLLAMLHQDDGLPAPLVGSLSFSPVTHTLWAGTNGGLAEIDPARQSVLRVVTKADGLVDNEVWYYGSVAAGPDGTILFGTARGLALYTPALDRKNTAPPALRVEEASFREGISGDNEITFEYTALSFGNERKVLYRTRLLGYDDDWSPEKADFRIRYTNLSAFLVPREYTFEVAARNNDGVWTAQPVRHTFTVQPPWWFQWWWLLSNIAALAVVTVGYSRYRTRQLERRSRELERTVEERTQEIRVKAQQISRQKDELADKNSALEEANAEILRTQEQLITQEKLASLGALTAGIAHEIKNPLNFVNNFSEVSVDIAKELQEDLEAVKSVLDPKMAKRIVANIEDLAENAAKIHVHGKRADGIVRGMLMHSRGTSGERQRTNLATMLEEHVTLAYHGFKAQDQVFDAAIRKEFDPAVGEIEVIQQEMGRVFLNIVNNACHSMQEKKKVQGEEYRPELTVTTKDLGGKVEIRFRDNGKGMPKEVASRVFEPFFTTKPTGQGTGLGMSISYDIVTKTHGGEFVLDTREGEYAEFVIRLPSGKK